MSQGASGMSAPRPAANWFSSSSCQRPGALGQLEQEALDLFCRLGHPRGQPHCRVILEAEETSLFGAQAQHFPHPIAVIVHPGLRPLVRCARGIGTMKTLAQLAVI